MHAATPQAKSPLISFYNSQKYLAKISVGFFTKWLQFIFTADGWKMYPFNLPLSATACCWVPFRLSKHRLSNILSQHQSNSQAELSKPTRENFKISKIKRTRTLSEYIPVYQSSLQCDVCIPSHLVTMSVAKGRASPPWKNFLPSWKISWTYCMHKHCFRACSRCTIWASLRKLFAPPPGVQSWLRVCWWLLPCDFCQLCDSAQSCHNHIFQV